MKNLLLIALLSSGAWAGAAKKLDRLDGARLVASPGNDGDSFLVEHQEKRLVVRLYYVDCPETHAGTEADARRVREQARYFGLASDRQVFEYGRQAAAFTKGQLARPFTVHTAYADALGRTPGGRVYGFVTTAEGRDLAELLVENGLARAYGYRRALPDGTPQGKATARMAEAERRAAAQRRGAWAESRPENDREKDKRKQPCPLKGA